MTYVGRIAIVVTVLILWSCKDDGGPVAIDATLKHSTLPISDSVAVPTISRAININTNEVSLLINLPHNAQFYEIDRTTDTTTSSWQLVFVGDTIWYHIGVVPPTPSVFYRGRAVYSEVTSRWTGAMRVNP